MTELLEQAIEKAKSLPAQRQDELGEIVLALIEQENSSLGLSETQRDEVRRRLANPGPFMSEQDMATFFRKLAG